jgi:hypothetical protein
VSSPPCSGAAAANCGFLVSLPPELHWERFTLEEIPGDGGGGLARHEELLTGLAADVLSR